jgi:hypothetical protein
MSTRAGANAVRVRLRDHEWSPFERAMVIAVIAIAMGALFVTSYSLALGDPVPHASTPPSLVTQQHT